MEDWDFSSSEYAAMRVLGDSGYLVSPVERPECDILLVEIKAWEDERYGPEERAALEAIAPRIVKAEFHRVPIKDELDWVARAERLEHLSVMQCGATDDGLRHIGARKSLKFLGIDGNPITDRGLSYLKEMDIGVLSLRGTDVTSAGIGELQCIESATQLGLWETKVGDELWSVLAKAQKLERLALKGTKVTGRGISALKHLRLLDLMLEDSEFDNAGLAELAENVHVEWELVLSGTKVDDDGVQALCKMDGPLRIWLERTKLTDAGLMKLKDLVHPQYLLLEGTAVTDAGIEAFRNARPGKITSRFDKPPPDDPLRIETNSEAPE